MAHQRGHRNPGDLEVGATDVFMRHPTPHVAPRPEAPEWLQRWEAKRPRWLMELVAEFFGVFLYCVGGMGASAAFYTSSAAKEVGFGSIQTVGFAYALAIALAIIIVGPTSGAQINPCFTIAFCIFKGFPLRKVPQYICAQILGGFVAGLVVYLIWKQPLDLITEELRAAGAGAAVFSPTGPASPIALFKGSTQGIGYVFFNEFVCAMIIAIAVFSILDPSNIFASPVSAPLLIGSVYAFLIWCFAAQSLALNTARDLGGRFAAAAIWGRGAFPPGYSALAALTNIAATLVGASFQVLFLSDTNRPHVHGPATPAVTEAPLPDPTVGYFNERNDLTKRNVSHVEKVRDSASSQ